MTKDGHHSRFKAFIEQVREATDLVDLIGKDVTLKPAGNTLVGLSPFREEKHPSFTVWPHTQTWCDFAGNSRQGGDVFAYIQQRDSVTFKEALMYHANKAGIRHPEQNEAAFQKQLHLADERRDVNRLLTEAAEYYHLVLPSRIKKQWLQERYVFDIDIINKLMLGWADGHLYDYFIQTLNVSRKVALKTGLFVVTKRGICDLFQDRIVFPYWKQNQVVYFTARRTEYTEDVPWEQAKYKKLLTHSEKHQYVSKSLQNDHFYNEDSAHGAKELLITEGTTDCISAMQCQIPCISPSTTRFRKQDIPKLLTLTKKAKRIIICNDTETNKAGINGALETAKILFEAGRDVRIAKIPLPNGKDKIDLNELIANQGKKALFEVLQQASPYIEGLINDVPSETDKTTLAEHLKPILSMLIKTDPIARQEWIERIANRFEINKRTVAKYQKQVTLEQRRKRSPNENSELPQIITNGRQLLDIVQESVTEIKKTYAVH